MGFPVSPLSKPNNTPREFLDEAYQTLHYDDGALLDAASLPNENSQSEWINKGDWLVLASEIGAEKVFFVNNDPVIVFCAQQNADEEVLLNLFRRFWCMARPQCLFLALPGELRVYSLNQKPARDISEWRHTEPLNVVRQLTDVAQALQVFRREQIETGYFFEDNRFGEIEERADKRLIRDLQVVRHELLVTGLQLKYAHALIGRSIFIRYLEDREILTSEYFDAVANQNTVWKKLLSDPSEKPNLSSSHQERRYDRVLQDKSFTYALYAQLAHDFNGDMFPKDEHEENEIGQTHLDLLRLFLLGDVNPQQPSLFFWAYDFRVIPTDLISSIYETFYHENNEDDDKGTHYTPSVLVEYALSNVLTVECLAANPKILDPACGSGIFLVEAFRRIVRFQVRKLGRRLNSTELRAILQNQIAGIEINTEAVHVAAFSLYLAQLHYQEPPDIWKSPRLPSLIFRSGQSNDDHNFGILFNNNTFSLTYNERKTLQTKIESLSRFTERAATISLLANPELLPVLENSFDIIIGNPPWGFRRGASPDIEQAQIQVQLWCKSFGWSVGDQEQSQAFIARALSLLKLGGECAFLVSTGLFFKHHNNSQLFRQRWLQNSTVKSVINFSRVRHIFFSADSPFAFVHFKSQEPSGSHRIQYWSAKRTEAADKLQAVILSRNDLKQVNQIEILESPILWKIYWWGNQRDAALINSLKLNVTLQELTSERKWSTGRGFDGSSTAYASEWLAHYQELPIKYFSRYGSTPKENLITAPSRVSRRGGQDLYSGWRLLIKRGITQKGDTPGQIIARLDDESYCFRNSIHAIRMENAADWERKILIGILWSSLARYFYFLTSSTWGMWHDEIHLEEAMTLPVRFPKNDKLKQRIVQIVDKLRRWSNPLNLISPNQRQDISSLEAQLDTAIFELFDLSQPERDLITDMCNVSLKYLYQSTSSRITLTGSRQIKSGTIDSVPTGLQEEDNLNNYLRAFLEVWNRELEPDGEFQWRIIQPTNSPMLGVIFTTQEKGKKLSIETVDDDAMWKSVLDQCSHALRQEISRNIYVDGMIRAVADTDIYVIKRSERRLWTQSMAREDAEATLLQAMHLQKA